MLKPNRIEDPYGQIVKFQYPDPSPGTPGTYLVAERGGVASLSGAGATTGYPGDPGNKAVYVGEPTTAKPIGLLLDDVWKIDTNRQHENFQKGGFVARVNQKACYDAKGEYQTNMIPAGITSIAAEQPAYLAASGKISNVQASLSGNSAPRVGTWKSAIDADGYAVIRMDI